MFLFVELVVFYVYMLKFEFILSNYYLFIFDVLKINFGNGYNKFSGIFVVLFVGVYVFIWIININFYGVYWINLMVNNVIVGGIVSDI